MPCHVAADMWVRVPNYSREGIVGTNRKSKGIMRVWDTNMGCGYQNIEVGDAEALALL